jgi:ribonuclease HI
MEAIANILDYVNHRQSPGNITIHSDLQGAIERAGHIGTGPGQERTIRVVKAVQPRHGHGWRTRVEWVPGHIGIEGNSWADQLAGEAAPEQITGRSPIT